MRIDITMASAEKVFEEFFEFCREVLSGEDPKFLELIKNRYYECNEDFRHSESMAVLLDETRCKMAAEKKRIFVHLKSLITSLKGKRKAKEALHLRKRKKDGRHLEEDIKKCVVVLENFQQQGLHELKSELVSNPCSPSTVPPKYSCAVTDGRLQLAETILIADEAEREEIFVHLRGGGGSQRECLRRNSFLANSFNRDSISKEDDDIDKPSTCHIGNLDFKISDKDIDLSIRSSTNHSAIEDGLVQTPHPVEGGLVQTPHPLDFDTLPALSQDAFDNLGKSKFEVPRSRRIKISKPVVIEECKRADATILPFYSKEFSLNYTECVHNSRSPKKIVHREVEYKDNFEVDGKEFERRDLKIGCKLGIQNGFRNNSRNFPPDLPIKVKDSSANACPTSIKASTSVMVEECTSADAIILPLSSETRLSCSCKSPRLGFRNDGKRESLENSNVEIRSEEDIQCCCSSLIGPSSLSGTERAAVVEIHVDGRRSEEVPKEGESDKTNISPIGQHELEAADSLDSTTPVPSTSSDTADSPCSTIPTPSAPSDTTNNLDSTTLVPSAASTDLNVNEGIAKETEGSHPTSFSLPQGLNDEVYGQTFTSDKISSDTNTPQLNDTGSGNEDSASLGSHLAQQVNGDTTATDARQLDEADVTSECSTTNDLTINGGGVNKNISPCEDKIVDSKAPVELDEIHTVEVGKVRRLPIVSLTKIDDDPKPSKVTFMGSLSLHSKTEMDTHPRTVKNLSDTDQLEKKPTNAARFDSCHKSSPQPSTSREDGGVLTQTETVSSEDEFQAQNKQFSYAPKKPPSDSVENRRVKKLETFLEKLRDEIEKCQKQELSLDDMEAEDSNYIYEDRLKKKFVVCWSKLCELTKRTVTTGRPTEKKICYDGTRYREINRRLEKFLNKHKVFPDFHDVKTIVKLSNKKYKLNLNHNKVCEIAREAFVDIGKMLQMRRHEDFIASFGSRQTDFQIGNPDPALFDPALRQRLEANRKVAKSNLENVITKYAEMQYSAPADCDSASDEDEEEEDELNKKAMSKEMDELVEEEEEEDDNAPVVRKKMKRLLDSDEEDEVKVKDGEPLDEGEDNSAAFPIEVDIASDDVVDDFGGSLDNKAKRRRDDWLHGESPSSRQHSKLDDGDEIQNSDLPSEGNMKVDVAKSSEINRKNFDVSGGARHVYSPKLGNTSKGQGMIDRLIDKVKYNDTDLDCHESVSKKDSNLGPHGSVDNDDDGEDSDVQIIDSDDKDAHIVKSAKEVSPLRVIPLDSDREKENGNQVGQNSIKKSCANEDLNKERRSSGEFVLSSHPIGTLNSKSGLASKASLDPKSEEETLMALSSHKGPNALKLQSKISPEEEVEELRDISSEGIVKDRSEDCSNIDLTSKSTDIIISPMPKSKPSLNKDRVSPNAERDSDNHRKVEGSNKTTVSSSSAEFTDDKESGSNKKDDSQKSTSDMSSVDVLAGPFEAENESNNEKGDVEIIAAKDSQETCLGGTDTKNYSSNKHKSTSQSDGSDSATLVILDVRTEADDTSWNNATPSDKTHASIIENQIQPKEPCSDKSLLDKESDRICRVKSQSLNEEECSGKSEKVSEASSESNKLMEPTSHIETTEKDLDSVCLLENQWIGGKIDSVRSCHDDSKISNLNENCVVSIDENSPEFTVLEQDDKKAESPADNVLKSDYQEKEKDFGNHCDADAAMSHSRDRLTNKLSFESKRNGRLSEEDDSCFVTDGEVASKGPEKGDITDSRMSPVQLQIDKVFTIVSEKNGETGKEKSRSDVSSYEVILDEGGDENPPQTPVSNSTTETLRQRDPEEASSCSNPRDASKTKINADGSCESKISEMEERTTSERGKDIARSTEDESSRGEEDGEKGSGGNDDRPDACTESSNKLSEHTVVMEEGEEEEEDIHDTVAKLCRSIIMSDSEEPSGLKEEDKSSKEDVDGKAARTLDDNRRETSSEKENVEVSETGSADEQLILDAEDGESGKAADVNENSTNSNGAVDDGEDNQESEDVRERLDESPTSADASDEPEVLTPGKPAWKETARNEVGKLLEEVRQLGDGKKIIKHLSDGNVEQSDTTVRKRRKSKTNESSADDDDLEITGVELAMVKRGRPPKSSINLSSPNNFKVVTARQSPLRTAKQFSPQVRPAIKQGLSLGPGRANYNTGQDPQQAYVRPSSQKLNPLSRSSDKGINWTHINESIAHELKTFHRVSPYPNPNQKGTSTNFSTPHSRSYPQNLPKVGHLHPTLARLGGPHSVVSRGRPSSVQSLRPRVPIPSLHQHNNTFSSSPSFQSRPSHPKARFTSPSGMTSSGKAWDRTPHSRHNQPARSLLTGSRIQPHVKRKLDSGCVMILDDSDEEDHSNTSGVLKQTSTTSTPSKNSSILHSRRGRPEAKRKAGPAESVTQSSLPKKPKTTSESAIVLSDSD